MSFGIYDFLLIIFCFFSEVALFGRLVESREEPTEDELTDILLTKQKSKLGPVWKGSRVWNRM